MLDTVFPFFVGHRTEVTAVAVALVNLAASCGFISHENAGQVTAVGLPMIFGFFAAKAARSVPSVPPVVAVAPVVKATDVSGKPVG